MDNKSSQLIYSVTVYCHYIKQMINPQNYYSSVYFLDHNS